MILRLVFCASVLAGLCRYVTLVIVSRLRHNILVCTSLFSNHDKSHDKKGHRGNATALDSVQINGTVR